MNPDTHFFDAGDVVLQSGITHRGTRLAYTTWGALNADRSNVILWLTPFGAHHTDIAFMVGPGKALDPDRWFIVTPNLFGNGLSSSPSNAKSPFDGSRWPNFTAADNVQVQQRFLREVFGIEQVALACGWSMGGIQAYHWAALFPQQVQRLAVLCGSARTSPHNRVFIDGVRHTLTADAHYQDGRFTAFPERGLRAMGRVYAGWAMSQTFYRQELWRQTGCSSLEDYLVAHWEGNFLRRDPANLLAMLWTWTQADISANAATTEGGLVAEADKKLTDAYTGIFRAFLKHRTARRTEPAIDLGKLGLVLDLQAQMLYAFFRAALLRNCEIDARIIQHPFCIVRLGHRRCGAEKARIEEN